MFPFLYIIEKHLNEVWRARKEGGILENLLNNIYLKIEFLRRVMVPATNNFLQIVSLSAWPRYLFNVYS